jgi:hypothetical protein
VLIGSALLVAATNYLPESISFDGSNFVGDASYMLIYYGPIYAPKLFQCSLDITKTTSTTLTCTTEAQLAGANKLAADMYFTITVDGNTYLDPFPLLLLLLY